MLYLIGLGLDEKGLQQRSLEILKRCKRVYLEGYTVDFPYSLKRLEEVLEKKIKLVDREFIENFKFLDEAKKLDVALLFYGSPLVATTHITILDEAKKSEIKTKVFHSASVFDAVTETGLQLYKFGKVASMPDWKDKGKSTSFLDVVKQNQSIDAHSLILIDIGLEFDDALKQLQEALKEKELDVKEIILCQTLGTKNSKIFYKKLKDFEEYDSVRKPYCIIIPGKLHFLEEEFLENFK